MATDEAIFRGSPASFESAVRAYDRQLGDQYRIPAGAVMIYKTSLTPGVPTRQDVAEVTVAISDLTLAEAASRGGSWEGPSGLVLYWNWRATITAHSMPDGRSQLVVLSEESIWPIAKAHWDILRAELLRLGYIEPEPAKRKKRKADEIADRQAKVREYFIGGYTIEEIAKRQLCGMSTVNRDLKELEAAGKIKRDKSASATKTGTKDGTAMTQDR